MVTVRLTVVKSAEGSETGPTTSEGNGGEPTEETKQDTPMV